jgi:hypothetical protein
MKPEKTPEQQALENRVNEYYDQNRSHACDEWAESDAFFHYIADSVAALKRGEDVKWSVRQGISGNRACGVSFADVLEAVTNHPDWLGEAGDDDKDTLAGGVAMALVQSRTGLLEVLQESAAKLFEFEAIRMLDREADCYAEYLQQENAERIAEDKADRQRYGGVA